MIDMEKFLEEQNELLNSEPKTFEERIRAFEAGMNMLGVSFKINLAIHDGKFAFVDAENNKKMAIKKDSYTLKNN